MLELQDRPVATVMFPDTTVHTLSIPSQYVCMYVAAATECGPSSLERLSRQVQGRGRLEPIEERERVIPIQRQQQPVTTSAGISRHYAMYKRRASNVEPTLSPLSSSPSSASPSSHSVIVGGDDLSGGFCLSVGRHSRGFSLSLRPSSPQHRSSPIVDQQRPLVNVVMPTADASLRQPSPRQPSPSNCAINIHDSIQPTQTISAAGGDARSMDYRSAVSDDQPSRFTIYQPLLATGRTSAQQFYDLPRRHLLLSPQASPTGLSACLSVCLFTCFSACLLHVCITVSFPNLLPSYDHVFLTFVLYFSSSFLFLSFVSFIFLLDYSKIAIAFVK